MLTECIEVFAKDLKQKGMGIILDNYVPADGTYIIVNKEGNVESCTDIKFNKKDGKLEYTSLYDVFQKLCFYDYASKLITMNKPMDSKKVIHSNNYLSFFVKKDSLNNGKLNDDIIDNYFNTLKDPLNVKYKKSKEATRIYQEFVNQNGEVDNEFLERNRTWIKQHIFHLNTLIEADLSKKDYLKIFFEADKQDFERESKRYILPNIYNKNDYNLEIEGKIYGLPNDNLSMNDKKPYTASKTRKISTPYLIDGEEVLLQKNFFDYLMNEAAKTKYNVYIDTQKNIIKTLKDKDENLPEIKSGYYLRIKKGTEVEILAQDNITNYHNTLEPFFEFKDILNIDYATNEKYAGSYKIIETRSGIGALINQIFFSKYLQSNYFTEASDIKNIYDRKLLQMILLYRNTIFDWVYKGIDNNFSKSIDKFALILIKANVLSGFNEKAICQFNLWWSLNKYLGDKEKSNMGDIVTSLRTSLREQIIDNKTDVKFANDREYFYGVGQLMYYLISLSKAKDKTQSLLNPIINVKNTQILKDRILNLYKKYNYDIKNDGSRFNKLLTMILGYTPDNHKIQEDMIILGFVDNSIIYAKDDKKVTMNKLEQNV